MLKNKMGGGDTPPPLPHRYDAVFDEDLMANTKTNFISRPVACTINVLQL